MNTQSHSVQGNLRSVLRLEGLAVFGLSVLLYHQFNNDWRLFALLFLVPDISLLGYLASARIGAITYNICHSYLLPIMLSAWFMLNGSNSEASLVLIWFAHLGFDRALGYGLKYASAFGHTHLGVVGKEKHLR